MFTLFKSINKAPNQLSLLVGKTIAIVGAGPAGLTAARLLQMRGGNVCIFERDISLESRVQGGSLDLHEDTGQLAIREMGLEAEFSRYARPEGQGFKVLNKHGQIQFDIPAENFGNNRPEIDRGELRRLLVSSLAPNTVIWDRQLTQIVQQEDAQYQLTFHNGITYTADLVIGCDGAWSKVRSLVSPIKPSYSGVSLVETRITSVSSEISSLVGNGSIMALGDNKFFMAQRNSNGSITLWVAFQVFKDWINEQSHNFQQPEYGRKFLLEKFADWDLKLREMISQADNNFIPRAVYGLPVKQNWPTKPGVTLMGDAAHLMPPFAGEGANMGMLDAVMLTNCLSSSRFTNIVEAIQAYEEEMLQRTSKAIQDSMDGQKLFIAESPDALVASFLQGSETFNEPNVSNSISNPNI